ncbi:MAG: helix-hairpin-helix domain-containing protein [bacterium]
MDSQRLVKFKLPDKPGVYFFRRGKNILYIGKATSLKDRTKSYFSKDLIATRGLSILDMVVQADNVDWQTTDSVLEALILEAELIKKHQPKYNVKEKDDRSWNYVCITDEEIPRVIVVRGKNLQSTPWRRCKSYGPYTNGLQLKEALKIIRKIFPFLDEKSKNNYEFYKQLKLVPEDESYIKNIKLFFEGKKRKILKDLEKEMKMLAKTQKFERANDVKRQIFALQHIHDVSLIKNHLPEHRVYSLDPSRIESYDVAHMSGKNMVGVMTVIEQGEIVKSEYKKFIIRTQSGANDTGALEEILSRRFRHTEWGLPNLVVVDGSIAQMNVAKSVLNRYQFKIPVVGVVKDDKHKAKAIQGDEAIIKKYKSQILLANSEAHRFAITFHRSRRSKVMLESLLDEIPGLGSARRTALLDRFGSVTAIRKAAVGELATTPGIGEKLAETIAQSLAQIGKSEAVNMTTGEITGA